MKVFGFAGWSGSGKTTLVEHLVALLVARGLRVSLIKHAHHDFDVDQPGKDSWRHRQAGCSEVLVSSAKRWALVHELRDNPELPLDAAVARLSPCDLVLVEGYKMAVLPKLEVWREAVGKARLHPNDPHILAVATDRPASLAGASLPVFDLADVAAIATFVWTNATSRPLPIDAVPRGGVG